MSRDQMFLFGAALLIAGGIWFVCKEYQLSTAASAAAPAPEAAPVSAPVSAPEPVAASAEDPSMLYDTPATEEIPRHRSQSDDAVVAHAKDAPASMLDSSLPHQSAGYWIAYAAGPSAGVRWDVNNCPGARKRRDSRPVCAQATVKFLNGTRFNALLLVGEQPLNPVGPIRYTQPSLLWASYKKFRGPLVPAPLSLLTRVAQEAY